MGVIKPRKTVVPIFGDDDLDRMADLRNKAERAALTGGRAAQRLDDDDLAAAFRAYDDFMDEANERAAKVYLAALRKGDYRDLVAEHPPRPDVKDDADKVIETFEQDAEFGFNADTLARPLILACMKRWDVEYGPAQEFSEEDVDEVCDADFSRIFGEAFKLNEGAGPDPKARLSSLLDRTSSETSESPERLD